MINRAKVTGQVIALSLVFAASAFAQGKSTTNQGATPNGKPFKQIQSQFVAVDQQLEALNQQLQALAAQVAGTESNLQAQIDTINATLTNQQGQIDSLAGASSSLEARVAASESAIDALNAAVADLQAQLAAAQTLLASHTGDISALQASVSSINVLINAHNSQIAALELQQQQMSQFLTNLANGSCQIGEAIQGITSGGAIVCTQAGGGTGTLQAYTNSAWNYAWWGANGMSVSCNAGDVATGTGFSIPSWSESVSNNYVSYYYSDYGHTEYEYYWEPSYGYNNYWSYWDTDWVAIPYTYNNYYAYTQVSSVSYSNAYSPSATVWFNFTPSYFYSYYWGYSVSVNCLRLQP